MRVYDVTPSIANWTWPGQESKDIQVEVYSGADKIRFFLNGKLVGEAATGREQQFEALFTVPYAPGVLKPEGVRADHVVTETSLMTAGEATQLRLR